VIIIKEEIIMKNFKKIVALGIVSTMVFGSSLTAFATEPTTNIPDPGDGTTAGPEQTVTGSATSNYVNKKVFKVTVPTQTEANKLLSFYSDPQGVIAETNGAQAGDNVTVTNDTGILFKNTDASGNVSLSDWSDPLKIVNKSSSGVQISAKVKLEEAASDKYATGYSTTVDFSTTDDKAKGLYLALWTTGDVTTPLTETEKTITNVAKSSYSLFEVGYSGGAYTFTIPEANEGKEPVFEIYATGALNRALPETTWYKADPAKPLEVGAPLKMPNISVKYTPNYIDAKMCQSSLDNDGLWVWNLDDTPFTKAATIANLKVNDIAVTGVTACDADGYVKIPLETVYTTLGLTGDNKTVEKAKEKIQGISATVGGTAIYADFN